MWQNRSLQKEKLDDLAFSGEALQKTLRQLGWINRWLGTHRSILQALPDLLPSNPPARAIQIVDLGCGGGDLLRKVALWGRQHHYQFRLLGIDGNAHSLQYAASLSSDFPEISFLQQDLLADSSLPAQTDIVLSSQFLYHYSDEALSLFFEQLSSQSRYGLISSDLHRHILAHFAFATLTFLFPFHPIIRQDGLQAIKRGFQRTELDSILLNSGLTDFRLRWVWAFRYQLVIFTSSYV